VIIRRGVLAGGLALVWIAVAATPSVAEDLADYLGEADQAVYSGQRIIRTMWDGYEKIAIVDVEHAGGLTMLGRGDDRAIVGDGKMHPMASGEGAVAFLRKSVRSGDDRYTVVEGGSTYRQGRDARVLDVMEGDLLRMRLVLDRDTAAPLATQVFDDMGRPFREMSMVGFVPRITAMPSPGRDGAAYDVMMPATGARLPAAAGGYDLVDVYLGPGGARHGFYTDGLFSFSLFASDGSHDVHRIASAGTEYRVDGYEYTRDVTAADVRVLWTGRNRTLVLVGDLPPDHLEAALADLPRPARRSWFKTIWRKLFG